MDQLGQSDQTGQECDLYCIDHESTKQRSGQNCNLHKTLLEVPPTQWCQMPSRHPETAQLQSHPWRQRQMLMNNLRIFRSVSFPGINPVWSLVQLFPLWYTILLAGTLPKIFPSVGKSEFFCNSQPGAINCSNNASKVPNNV